MLQDYSKLFEDYVRLDAVRDGGDVIWRLCELSAEVMDESKYGDCATLELSLASKVSIQTIVRRKDAWLAWQEFHRAVIIVSHDTGEHLTILPVEIDNKLQKKYTYYASIGQYYRRGEITNTELVSWLEKCAREGWSTREFQNKLQEIYGQEKKLDSIISRFKSAAIDLLDKGEELKEKGLSYLTTTANQVAQFVVAGKEKSMDTSDVKCPSCGLWLVPWNFCPQCGYPFKDKADMEIDKQLGEIKTQIEYEKRENR